MIAVIDFGMGNIHSILKAISLYTDNYKLIQDPKDLENVKGIILPGDGAFEKAISNLTENGMMDTILNKVENGIPLFGICIGFQILFQDSEESVTKGKVIKGMGLVKGNVRKFKGKDFKVPHMGWNKISFSGITKNPKNLLEGIENDSHMYFIHSFRPTNVETANISATCKYYDENFPVIIEKGNIFGTQFHPEKSDKEGLKILNNFIQLVEKC